MINLRTVAALAPVGAGFWLITHPGLASSLIAAGTVGAAVVQHTITKQKAERAAVKEATLAEQNGQAIEERVADALREFRALPQTAQTTLDERIAQMRNRAQTIDYTNASREVTRKV